MNGPAALSLKNVSFAYNGEPILEAVHLTVPPGDFACIIGPNGGGKSTLLKLMIGLLPARTGQVLVFGQPPAQARLKVGYLAQHLHFDRQFPVTVSDVVLMGRLGLGSPLGRYSRVDRGAARQALHEVGIADLERRPFAALSGGQRQRVLIARALACEPELLLLDEPFAGLDIHAEEQLYGLLGELNRRLTIVLVSHDVAYVSKFVQTAICVNRHVHTHAASELHGEVIRRLYGREVRLVHGGRDQSGARGV